LFTTRPQWLSRIITPPSASRLLDKNVLCRTYEQKLQPQPDPANGLFMRTQSPVPKVNTYVFITIYHTRCLVPTGRATTQKLLFIYNCTKVLRLIVYAHGVFVINRFNPPDGLNPSTSGRTKIFALALQGTVNFVSARRANCALYSLSCLGDCPCTTFVAGTFPVASYHPAC
jgi:hypothetical protein